MMPPNEAPPPPLRGGPPPRLRQGGAKDKLLPIKDGEGDRDAKRRGGGAYSANPTNVAASPTDLRRDTTAFAGKLSSG